MESIAGHTARSCRKRSRHCATSAARRSGSTRYTLMRALTAVIGVEPTGVAITDLRFLIEMRGIKAMGGKILHLQAADEQANVAPELRGHRSEVELDSPEVLEMRDAYSQHPPLSTAPRLRAARNLPCAHSVCRTAFLLRCVPRHRRPAPAAPWRSLFARYPRASPLSPLWGFFVSPGASRSSVDTLSL
jgi:hypothetical protein